MITTKLVTLDDLEQIKQFIKDAQAHLKEQGSRQWQNGYPNEEIILKDIAEKRGYFLCDTEEPVAYFCLDFAGDTLYETLQGEWLTQGTPYAALHRVAMGAGSRGKGYGTAIFQQAEKLSRQARMTSIRIDTNPANQKMQHLIKKNGFQYCGTVVIDATDYLAFEKLL